MFGGGHDELHHCANHAEFVPHAFRHGEVVQRGLEPRTSRSLPLLSDQLSDETSTETPPPSPPLPILHPAVWGGEGGKPSGLHLVNKLGLQDFSLEG